MLIVTFEELCQSQQINEEWVFEVIEYGIAEPVSGDSGEDWVFDTNSAHWIRKAIRLHQEFESDWVAIAMVINLLKQNEALQADIQYLKNRLERLS